jgi:hypothetical protein
MIKFLSYCKLVCNISKAQAEKHDTDGGNDLEGRAGEANLLLRLRQLKDELMTNN